MKKRRKIRFSNRLHYTLIILGILIIVAAGAYAATIFSASGSGHPYTELSTCPANQILKMDATGTSWACADNTASAWSAITGKPAGFADDTDNGITSETDPTVKAWAKTDTGEIEAWSVDFYSITGYKNGGVDNQYTKPNEDLTCSSSEAGHLATFIQSGQDQILWVCLADWKSIGGYYEYRWVEVAAP